MLINLSHDIAEKFPAAGFVVRCVAGERIFAADFVMDCALCKRKEVSNCPAPPRAAILTEQAPIDVRNKNVTIAVGLDWYTVAHRPSCASFRPLARRKVDAIDPKLVDHTKGLEMIERAADLMLYELTVSLDGLPFAQFVGTFHTFVFTAIVLVTPQFRGLGWG
jgi:hypothetical protein